jgi:hypothetical protein
MENKNVLYFTILEEDYLKLHRDIRALCVIDKIKMQEEDFKSDGVWCLLKRKASKAYRDLRNREYDLRHNPNQDTEQ